MESSKQTLDHWQQNIDERIRAILPGVGHFRELKDEVKRLTQRVDELELRLNGASGADLPAGGDAVRNESVMKE